MVGFEVSINGRFWVSTEVAEPDTPTESALGSLKGDTLDQPIPQAAPAKHSVLLSNTDLVVLRG